MISRFVCGKLCRGGAESTAWRGCRLSRGIGTPGMDPSKDYYKEMGLGESASQADVKKAYIKLVKQYHPDQNKGTLS